MTTAQTTPIELEERATAAAAEFVAAVGSEALASRMTGEVRRYHAWHVSREQTTADHTWHVMRIYAQLFGPPPTNVWHAALFHDVGELLGGDVQHPVKLYVPQMKELHDTVELAMQDALGMRQPVLTVEQRWRIKLCDLLEMYEFGTREVMAGNVGTGRVVRSRIWRALEKHSRAGCATDMVRASHHVIEVNKWIGGEEAC